jgi:hypothetical protein
LLEDGYVIVERLAPDLTDRALAELSADIDAAPTGRTDFLGNRTKRLGGCCVVRLRAAGWRFIRW